MAAPTNPFASALGGHKDDAEQQQQQQYQPHNPFAPASASTAAPRTSSDFHNQPSAASNPFAQSDGFSNTSTAPYSIPEQFPQPGLSNNHQFESANDISQQLSGLDFANPPVDNLANRQQLPDSTSAAAAPTFPQSNTTPQESSPSTYQVPEAQPAAMTTTFAPPPGPPPGHFDGYSNYSQPQQQDAYHQQAFSAPPLQSSVGNAANPMQADSDEAYARQLLAEDEARVKQRQGGRHQSSNGAHPSRGNAPSASTGTGMAPLATPAPRDPNEEKQWNTKEVYWQHRLQRIIIQNENGPCSLIALCNVLLLRGTLQITPEDRPAVSYSYLSSLLGEHLIDVISTSGSDSAMDLEAALSILPQTQYGLDVNVCFASIFGFSVDEGPQEQGAISSELVDMSSGTSGPPALPNAEKQKQRGELALFKLCKVSLVHGWLADEDDKETWAAVVERSGDYDKALDRVVAGDEVAKGNVVESQGNGGDNSSFATDSLPSHEALLVKDAILIRNFLESTATQLTYPGLYALSTKLERGVPYALFRNSHISVLYRPTAEELQLAAETLDSANSAAQPQLYQLVTDSTLENEDAIVWESVEDVDGSASRFYDGKFRESTPSQDFIGNHGAGNQGNTGEDADFAYAQQLQDQESQRARRQHRQQQQPNNRRQNYNYYAPPPGGSQTGTGGGSSGGGGGGMSIISRMLAGRKSNKSKALSNDARTSNYPNVPDTTGLTMSQGAEGEQSTELEAQRILANQRKADKRRFASNSDRTNENNPRPEASSTSADQETAPGQEYNNPKKEKWFKKLF